MVAVVVLEEKRRFLPLCVGRKEHNGSIRMLEVRNRRSGVENDLCCGVASKLTVGVSVSFGVGDGVAEGLVLSIGERVRTSLSS